MNKLITTYCCMNYILQNVVCQEVSTTLFCFVIILDLTIM
jgi:hypothetical protein